MQIWYDAVATFIGNAMLLAVAFGMWKAQKVKHPDDSPGWVALLAVILPLMAVAGTLYVQKQDRPVAEAASLQETEPLAPEQLSRSQS